MKLKQEEDKLKKEQKEAEERDRVQAKRKAEEEVFAKEREERIAAKKTRNIDAPPGSQPPVDEYFKQLQSIFESTPGDKANEELINFWKSDECPIFDIDAHSINVDTSLDLKGVLGTDPIKPNSGVYYGQTQTEKDKLYPKTFAHGVGRHVMVVGWCMEEGNFTIDKYGDLELTKGRKVTCTGVGKPGRIQPIGMD